MRQNCNLLVLLFVASISAYIPSANGATALFIPSAASQTTKSRKHKHKDAVSAAKAMNSVAFLSQLVALKDTSDVRYFQSNEQETAVASISRGGSGDCVAFQERKLRHRFLRRVVNVARRGTVQLFATAGPDDIDIDESKVDCGKSQEASNVVPGSTTTEYTGNLWFMRNKGIRFRETIRVSEISRDGISATVECITKYRTKGQWHDCSKVVCTMSAADQGINIVTNSEVLVSLPLPGLAGKAVRSKIASAFNSAAQAFFEV